MILSIVSQKGGTGKSTTAAALAQAAAAGGLSVLAVDSDPQGTLSFFLKAKPEAGSYEMITRGNSEAYQKISDGLYCSPANQNLATVTSRPGSAKRLSAAVEPLKRKFDLIIIDVPPTAGELQYNAIYAADEVLIPVQCDIPGLQGIYQTADTARHIKPDIKFTGILITRFDGRSTLSRKLEATIRETAESISIPFAGTIRAAVAIQEAQTFQADLYSYAPKSKPAEDYKKLLYTILEG